ncbi:carotenoid cleavage dioxygenase 8 homolog B, chloroplastic-like [Cryptomeria japonica]|uniref:carotenoid cleavage dioxygenase 8 homolog B, chloroplastic-like n=1 Tax=Cryptomeria japonica TaxID=3369 RepID=UPI0027D9E389|nr:carotenoid cleavage dioxygenase 8 homolog B, chloroplastic-like [Cryptomeria japonica]
MPSLYNGLRTKCKVQASVVTSTESIRDEKDIVKGGSTQKSKHVAWQSVARESWEGELAVDGYIPKWLNGTYLRNGPGKFHVGDYNFRHLFDGYSTLVRLHFENGRLIAGHAQLESEAYKAAKNNNKICYREFSEVPKAENFFEYVGDLAGLFSGASLTDNANTGVIRLGDGRVVCLTETMKGSIQINPTTLETMGKFEYTDKLGGLIRSAHPMVFDTEFITLLPDLIKPGYDVVRMLPGTKERTLIGRAALPAEEHGKGMDMCSVNPKYIGKPYRYAYACGAERPFNFPNTLTKIDLKEKIAKNWYDEGGVPSEPFFVGQPGAEKEDDGVVISLISDGNGDGYALVLDGSTFTEIGRAKVPYGLPYGLHGCWVPTP